MNKLSTAKAYRMEGYELSIVKFIKKSPPALLLQLGGIILFVIYYGKAPKTEQFIIG